MFEGILRVSPDLAALIRVDEETKQTDKAVYIDAQGNETPICIGGSGSIETATVTVVLPSNESVHGYIWDNVNNKIVSQIYSDIGGSVDVEVILINGVGFLYTWSNFENANGDVEIVTDMNGALRVTGDGSVAVQPIA